jgi:glycerophosphoryl diester phosphodiesterase
VSSYEQGERIRVAIDVCAQQRGIVYGVSLGLTLDHCSFADPCAFDSAATVRQGLSKGMGGLRSETGPTADRTTERLGGSQRFDHVPTSSWLELIRADNSPDTVSSAGRGAPAPQVRFLAPSAKFRRVMRNVVRALKVMIAVGAAITLLAPAAEAEPLLQQIAVAHRGGAVTTFGEGTMLSYQDAVKNGANILEGDIHWTKDSPNDSDSVGSILIIHDSTLDRITNCSGSVSSWYWSSIRDKCYVNVGVSSRPRLIRINDLVAYATPLGKTLAINLKNSTLTTAQAKQLWGHLKNSKVHLHASWSNRAALYKVRDQDRADSTRSINYALSTDGAGGWPSVERVKSFGTFLYAKKSIPPSQMATYKNADPKINVILWTGNDEEDYVEMTKLEPYGVIVDDVEHFQAWRQTQI